jgi:selenium-binding protein 1
MEKRGRKVLSILIAGWLAGSPWAFADESPFVKHLEGREKVLYVIAGDGDQQDNDFLAVIDVDPASRDYGRITYTVDVGSRGNEVHHFGFTADRKRILAGSLYSSRIFVFDVASDPGRPRLLSLLEGVDKTVGYCCPHTFHALPTSVLVTMLGSADGGLPGGLAEFSNEGKFLGHFGPGPGHSGEPIYMYDVGVKREINRMITSTFTPLRNYRLPLGKVNMGDFGDKVVVWDFKERKILQVATVDKSPLEVRWLHDPKSTVGFINCTLGNSIWMWRQKGDGSFQFRKVIDTGPGSLPTDMRISPDDKHLYVTLFGGHEVHQYDITKPDKPKLVSAVSPGPSPQMIHLSHDGKRLYVSNSVLSAWDYAHQMYVRLVHIGPDGMRVDPFFNVSFNDFPTGPARPHDILLNH